MSEVMNRSHRTIQHNHSCAYKPAGHSLASFRFHTLRWTLVCVRLWVGRGLVECFIFVWASLAKALVLTRPSAASIQLSTATSGRRHGRGNIRGMCWLFTMDPWFQNIWDLGFYEEHNLHWLGGYVECFIFLWIPLAKTLLLTRSSAASTQPNSVPQQVDINM